MDNVRFLKGTQANLNTKINGTGDRFQAGAFYLTTDTDRLYFAQTASELVDLNKSIVIVDSVSDLPSNRETDTTAVKGADVEIGRFYYVKAGGNSVSGNILAVCTAIDSSTGAITWTQVNPDTDTQYEFTYAANQLKLKNKRTSAEQIFYYDEQTSGTIDSTDVDEGVLVGTVTGGSVANSKMVVGHKKYTTANATAISNGAQTPSAGSTFDIITGISTTNGHVTSVTTGTVQIPAATVDTTYTLSNRTSKNDATASTNISLLSSSGTFNQVQLTSATDGLITLSAETGIIKFGHAAVTRTDPATVTANSTLAHGGTFTVVTGVTTSTQGHVTAVATRTFTLPSDTYLASAGIKPSDPSTLRLTLNTGANIDTPVTDGHGILYHKITVNGTENIVDNQGSLGSFYNAAKVDELIDKAKQGMNAMTYKGTVGTGGSTTTLPTTGVSNGDVYLVKTAGTYGGYNCDAGDLLVAKGTEIPYGQSGAGTIASADLSWDLVPSGDDVDTTYSFSTTSDSTHADLVITPSTLAAGADAPKIHFYDDDKWINVTASGTTGIKIEHAGPDNSTSAAVATSAETAGSINSGESFTALVGATQDEKGHILKVKTKQFTMFQDSKYSLGSAANSNAITLTGSQGANGSSTSVTIAAGTQIAVDGSTAGSITINHGTISSATTSATASINSTSRTFSVITGLTLDNGHTTSIETTTFTLPEDRDSTYALSGATLGSAAFGTDLTLANNQSVTFTNTLTGGGTANGQNSTSVFALKSKTLALGYSGTVAQIELQWGSF